MELNSPREKIVFTRRIGCFPVVVEPSAFAVNVGYVFFPLIKRFEIDFRMQIRPAVSVSLQHSFVSGWQFDSDWLATIAKNAVAHVMDFAMPKNV